MPVGSETPSPDVAPSSSRRRRCISRKMHTHASPALIAPPSSVSTYRWYSPSLSPHITRCVPLMSVHANRGSDMKSPSAKNPAGISEPSGSVRSGSAMPRHTMSSSTMQCGCDRIGCSMWTSFHAALDAARAPRRRDLASFFSRDARRRSPAFLLLRRFQLVRHLVQAEAHHELAVALDVELPQSLVLLPVGFVVFGLLLRLRLLVVLGRVGVADVVPRRGRSLVAAIWIGSRRRRGFGRFIARIRRWVRVDLDRRRGLARVVVHVAVAPARKILEISRPPAPPDFVVLSKRRFRGRARSRG
eukprot:30957-Pelagococcus_subviridis.AAC.74